VWRGPVPLGQWISDPGQTDNFARNKANLRLVPEDELVHLILQHYEKFDSRYKGLSPVNQVYVPDPERRKDKSRRGRLLLYIGDEP
jgi:hypothetical protein